MSGSRGTILAITCVSTVFFGTLVEAQAQQHVGYCHDQSRNQSFSIFENLYLEQVGFPANHGYAMRDPSGMTFMRIPSADPWNLAFFVDWQGVLVQVSAIGWQQIGYCDIAPGFMQQPHLPSPPPPGNLAVRTPQGLSRLPEGVGEPSTRYVAPLTSTPQKAEYCLQNVSDENEFADCMLEDMLGEQERNIYECAQEEGEAVDITLCSIGANGGENEREIVENVQRCREEHGDDWEAYPVCMMEDQMSEDQARLVNCLKEQGEGGEVSLTGTAVCYGGDFFNPNPELQIAMECAVSTGGEPMAFAGCAGGRLTERELKKCFTDGFGGNGCFGENNEIVKGLRTLGIDVQDALGPTNDLVVAWNNGVSDIQHGPGPNNDAMRAITTIGNDIANGPGENNDIVKAMDHVFSGFGAW